MRQIRVNLSYKNHRMSPKTMVFNLAQVECLKNVHSCNKINNSATSMTDGLGKEIAGKDMAWLFWAKKDLIV